MGLAPEATIEEFTEATVASIIADYFYGVPYTPTYLEGSAGAGKSSSIDYIRKALKEICRTEVGYFQFKAGTQTAQELWGVPFPVDINDNGNTIKVSKYLKNEDFPGIIPGKTPPIGIFHIDELTSMVDDQIKAAVTELTLEGKMADYTLPKGWYVICTGNERKDGNVYNKLPFPLRNRLRIMKILSTKKGWLDWANRNELDPAITSFISSTLDEREYLTFNPDLEDDGDDVDPNNYVASTYRSWAQVNNILRTYKMYSSDNKIPKIVEVPGIPPIKLCDNKTLQVNLQAILGKDLGLKFYEYFMSTNGININDILSKDWKDGKPVGEIEVVQNRQQLDYIVAQAKSAKDPLIPAKVIMYLQYCDAPESYITALLSTLTPEQNSKLKEYAVSTNSLNLITSLIEKSSDLDKALKETSTDGDLFLNSMPDDLKW